MNFLYFAIYALIVCVLVLSAGGTLIGYYFMKKSEYEANRAKKFSEILNDFAKFLKDFGGQKL